MSAQPLAPSDYEHIVRAALIEDLGGEPSASADLTSAALFDEGRRVRARIVARAAGRICGVDAAVAAFWSLDPGVECGIEAADGDDVEAGRSVIELTGSARGLLAAERTALNFLGHLSGIATATRSLVGLAATGHAKVLATRKTTPGLRVLEKYAVQIGGGGPHRAGLYDAVLIKDNHLALSDGVGAAVRAARAAAPRGVIVEVEVESLDALDQALDAGADVILLDNQPLEILSEAVVRAQGRALLEASGGITAATIAAVAATGVDFISVGWLTHSAPSLDVALDVL